MISETEPVVSIGREGNQPGPGPGKSDDKDETSRVRREIAMITPSQIIGASLMVPVVIMFLATAYTFGIIRALVIWGSALSTGMALLLAIHLMS